MFLIKTQVTTEEKEVSVVFSCDHFEIYSNSLVVYRGIAEFTDYDLTAGNVVYIMDHDGQTIDKVVVK